MAVDTTKENARKEVEKISNQAKINEAYFVGLLWANPIDGYGEYAETISMDEFIHGVWGFYFELGRRMYSSGIKTFDQISVKKFVKDIGVEKDFEGYGGLDTIDDAVEIVKANSENIEHYYETIKRNYTLQQLYLLFGDKVFLKKNKYNYEIMNREQLTIFWTDKLNKLSLNNVNNYEAENLYIDYETFIKKLEEDSAEMLPLYESSLWNNITQGVARGHVFMFGGFGNAGKSSIMAEKFVMSCLANDEKLLIVLNEETAQSFRQKIILSILNHEFKTGFDRKHMVNGLLTDDDKELIKLAIERWHELINGENASIKVIFMERYVMSDLEKIIRFWANRGYINLVIDTHKVSDDSKYDQRWQIFVEDMKTIYRLTRKNANGCFLRTWVNFQLADIAVKYRYLTFDAMAEGRGAKNEASVVQMFRSVWSDEYGDEDDDDEDEKNKKKKKKHGLICWKNKQNEITGEWEKEYFSLEKGKNYILVFTPKNRFGTNNDNGQPVLVVECNFVRNAFYEKGWCFVPKDFS